MTISRREFLRLSALTAIDLLLTACVPPIPTPPPTTKPEATPGVTPVVEATPTKVLKWSPGQPKEEMRRGLIGPNNESFLIEIINFTDIKFQLNNDTFTKLISFYYHQGGILPPKATIWFAENDLPIESPAHTDIEEDLIALSLGGILRHWEDYTPEGYSISEIINGILAGQLCYLMAGESQQMDLEGKPQTPENMNLVCGSYGVMFDAIMAGKGYQEYEYDVENRFYKKRGGKLITFDSDTYNSFQATFQEPLLIFEETPTFPSA